MNDPQIAAVMAAMKKLIQIGKIVEVDYDNARVRAELSGGLKSAWLRWGVERAGPDSEWEAPEKDEQVLILFPFGDESQGVVMLSLYSDQFPAPSNTADKWVKKFKDGTVITYDRAAKKLDVNLAGDINMDVKGQANINVTGKAYIKGQEVILNDGTNGGLVCQQHVCAFTGSNHPDASQTVKSG